MAMNAQTYAANTPLRLATTIAGSLHKLALVAFAASVIALAPFVAAYAQSSVASVTAGTTPSAKISREYLIKAAILYNFAKFAEWPAAAFGGDNAPLRICVIGTDPFGLALHSLDGKSVRSRPLVTGLIANVEEAAACHILFVSASEKGRMVAILDGVGALPILTVADMGQFTSSGGIVTLKKAEDRSRLEINIGAAEKAGLKLSSKLLRLADTVSTQTAQAPVPAK